MHDNHGESYKKVMVSMKMKMTLLIDENQSTKDPLQMPIRPITKARAKKLQGALNGFVKEFI